MRMNLTLTVFGLHGIQDPWGPNFEGISKYTCLCFWVLLARCQSTLSMGH
jgi:hypothetical protein